MPSYVFTARDFEGREQSGIEAADTPAALAGQLRARGLVVVDVRPADEEPAAAGPGMFNPARLLPATNFDVEFGMRQLSSMIRSGITLLSALKTTAEQARRPRMGDIWFDVLARIEEGSAFADALARHGKRFPPLVVQLVRAGEQSGTLDTVLEQAADQLERRRNLKTTLVSALMYPAIVLIVAVAVAAFMVLKVIPIMQKFLTGRGRKLPAITQALLDVSNWVQAYLPGICIGIVSTIIVLIVLHRITVTGRWMDGAMLRIPLIGKLLRLAGTAMFARGLGLLLENGVALIDSLRTAATLLRNRALAGRVDLTRESVLAGGTLSRPLTAGREFMPMLGRMVAIGEETGTLGSVLSEVARFHEHQLAAWVRRLSVLIEPVITLVVGAIVGFVYIAFFVALFSLSGGGR